MRLALFLFLLTLFFDVKAQEKIEGLPDDLDKVKIVFLEYEQLPITDNMYKIVRKSYTKRNEVFIENNKELAKEVKNYPYAYVLSKRAEYKGLADRGYKYVLENDLLESFNNGLQTAAGGNIVYASPMYLKDIKTGTRYELFTVSEGYFHRYGWIISKFNEKVKRHYKKK